MKREYSTGTHDSDPDFFVGKEVEHTSAYGLKTLFCHGSLSLYEIRLKLVELNAFGSDGIDHVYLNHNHSECKDILNKILHLLSEGLLVTYEALGTDKIIDLDHHNLIHLLSIPVARAKRTNLFIKIDDIDFNATNPGVWTVNVGSLSDHFTPWKAYEGDKIL